MTLLKNKTLRQAAGIGAILVGVGAFWSVGFIDSIMGFALGPVSVSSIASALVIALGLDTLM